MEVIVRDITHFISLLEFGHTEFICRRLKVTNWMTLHIDHTCPPLDKEQMKNWLDSGWEFKCTDYTAHELIEDESGTSNNKV